MGTCLLWWCLLGQLIVFLVGQQVQAFEISAFRCCSSRCYSKCTASAHHGRLWMAKDGGGEDNNIMPTTASPADQDSVAILQSLRNRQKELHQGIGKRYITRTQQGFLNVHYEPTDPYDTDNIVHQLTEGQIVRSIAPPRGNWVQHDAGGWSIATFGGFTWLEEIQE